VRRIFKGSERQRQMYAHEQIGHAAVVAKETPHD